MPRRAIVAILVAAVIGLAPTGAMAQLLPGDHRIVPGVRIGAAELEPADQGALVRALGEPNRTEQRGDRAYYMYGAPEPDELVVNFDLAKDEPFEISTASPVYRTAEGLGVGSAATAIRAALGPPLCESGNDDGPMVYGAIWFLTSHGNVTKVFIRKKLSPDDFRTGPMRCR
ncbi:MAG: hypothetical protein V4527_11485 [Pseudomonadota bacterium]